ncbi:MAG: asparagine synthase (glutamine-hydrolyzing) [Chitinivibrionales bacterium]|nr:asparagine synthase (glutamine-hydrolyzing) [Chitinivibrionales bacterium]
MCGIAGIYSPRGLSSDIDGTMQRMVAVQRHRGPDECGVFLDDCVALGHARLSIIDHAGGKQPMHSGDEAHWIVYNGEIFNYIELRDELRKLGYRFVTGSDTEVALHGYREWGAECLTRFNGQFALGIWNRNEKSLFLARDRMGIRPLHWHRMGEKIVFASEIKGIFAHPAVKRELDYGALDQTFTFWTTLPGRTAFKGVFEVKPGHFLKIQDGKPTEQCYWSTPFTAKSSFRDAHPDALAEQASELLQDAVRIRLRADVTVGSYLSGGLDSSGVSSIIKNRFNAKLKTYGIGFEDSAFDESEFQRTMLVSLGADHAQITATNKLIADHFLETIWHTEKPLLRTAPVPLLLLSRHVHEDGIKVVLTGEGADEIFGGYNIFREALVRRFWARNPASTARPLLLKRLYPHIFKDESARKAMPAFFRQGMSDFGNPLFSHLVRWNTTQRIRMFLSSEVKSQLDSSNCIQDVASYLPGDFSNLPTLSKAQWLESQIFLSNYLLSSQGDRVAMANSLEIRLPYLDYRIIEFMAGVPNVWKILGLNEKYLLKKALGGFVPRSIANRNKHPYRAPIAKSLLVAGVPYADLLEESTLAKCELFDVNKVKRLFEMGRRDENVSETNEMAIAGIVSTMIMHDLFIEGLRFEQDWRLDWNVAFDLRNADSKRR